MKPGTKSLVSFLIENATIHVRKITVICEAGKRIGSSIEYGENGEIR